MLALPSRTPHSSPDRAAPRSSILLQVDASHPGGNPRRLGRRFHRIRSGLEEGQVVLVDGYQILEAGDDVQIETLDGEPLDDPLVLAEGDEPEIEEG